MTPYLPPMLSRQKEIVRIRAKINEIKTKKRKKNYTKNE
jgi:hypothetical protein